MRGPSRTSVDAFEDSLQTLNIKLKETEVLNIPSYIKKKTEEHDSVSDSSSGSKSIHSPTSPDQKIKDLKRFQQIKAGQTSKKASPTLKSPTKAAQSSPSM
jgi:hypothetical protein